MILAFCEKWKYGNTSVVLMEFYPSADDPERYTRIIEPLFLNALNKMSNTNTWMRVRKIDVFDKASKVHLAGFKGDKEESMKKRNVLKS
jgi:hypothetical protein